MVNKPNLKSLQFLKRQNLFSKKGRIILAVISIVAIGCSGIQGLMARRPLVLSLQTAPEANTIQEVASVPTSGVVGAVATSQGSFLDFKNEKVRFKLSDNVADAVYAPFNVSSTDSSIKSYGISTKSLIAVSKGSPACSAESGALGIIVIRSGLDAKTKFSPDNRTTFSLNDSIYQYVPPQNIGCVSDTIPESELRLKITSIITSFAGLQGE